MTPEQQIEALTMRVAQLEKLLNEFHYPDRYQFDRSIRHQGKMLSFFSQPLIGQWTSGTGRQDIHDNTGVAMNVGARFTGNVGTTYYGFGDVVAALKAFGFLQ